MLPCYSTLSCITGVRPYKCGDCDKAFTQRCSLESHCKKVHSRTFEFAYKERRTKLYVCEDCGHTCTQPEQHYIHLKSNHPNSTALLKCYDKRQFKFEKDEKTVSSGMISPGADSQHGQHLPSITPTPPLSPGLEHSQP